MLLLLLLLVLLVLLLLLLLQSGMFHKGTGVLVHMHRIVCEDPSVWEHDLLLVVGLEQLRVGGLQARRL